MKQGPSLKANAYWRKPRESATRSEPCIVPNPDILPKTLGTHVLGMQGWEAVTSVKKVLRVLTDLCVT